MRVLAYVFLFKNHPNLQHYNRTSISAFLQRLLLKNTVALWPGFQGMRNDVKPKSVDTANHLSLSLDKRGTDTPRCSISPGNRGWTIGSSYLK